jgi:hypothetical protein
VVGGPDNRGAVGAENSTAKGSLGTPTNFLIEFVQISGVHLIVSGGSDPQNPPVSYAADSRGMQSIYLLRAPEAEKLIG